MLLDRLSNPKFWRTLPISQATNLALHLAYFTCYLPLILDIGSSEEILELSLYHTAFLWQRLPRSSRTVSVEAFIKHRVTLQITNEVISTMQKIKCRTRPIIGPCKWLLYKTRVGVLKRRLLEAMFDQTDAVYQSAISVMEIFRNNRNLFVCIDVSARLHQHLHNVHSPFQRSIL